MKKIWIVFLLVLLLSSSQKQCYKNTMQSTDENCQINAIFRYNMCSVGLWNAMVLELENGEIVQPWYTNNDNIRNFKPQKDMKVRVTLTEVPIDDRYANVITCMAVGEYQGRIRRYVRVDCLQLVN
jgi:hypothetical protein